MMRLNKIYTVVSANIFHIKKYYQLVESCALGARHIVVYVLYCAINERRDTES